MEPKAIKITLSQFCGEQVILVDYEDGTYKTIFIS